VDAALCRCRYVLGLFLALALVVSQRCFSFAFPHTHTHTHTHAFTHFLFYLKPVVSSCTAYTHTHTHRLTHNYGPISQQRKERLCHNITNARCKSRFKFPSFPHHIESISSQREGFFVNFNVKCCHIC
jgi:hypothetical protein